MKELDFDYILDVNNIKIYVKNKHIKNMYLKIKNIDNNIVVYITASKMFSKLYVTSFVKNNIDWIYKKIDIANKKIEKISKIENGSSVLYFGNKYVLNIKNGFNNAVQVKNNEILIILKREEDCLNLYKNWQKRELTKYLNTAIEYWSNEMKLYPSNFYIRDMKTRWGTCNTKTHRICFSLKLIEKTYAQIDYVVIHELAHLKYPNHQIEFKLLVQRYCPEWLKIRKSLKS